MQVVTGNPIYVIFRDGRWHWYEDPECKSPYVTTVLVGGKLVTGTVSTADEPSGAFMDHPKWERPIGAVVASGRTVRRPFVKADIAP